MRGAWNNQSGDMLLKAGSASIPGALREELCGFGLVRSLCSSLTIQRQTERASVSLRPFELVRCTDSTLKISNAGQCAAKQQTEVKVSS